VVELLPKVEGQDSPAMVGRMDGKRDWSEKLPNPPRGDGVHHLVLIVFFMEPAVGIEPTTC